MAVTSFATDLSTRSLFQLFSVPRLWSNAIQIQFHYYYFPACLWLLRTGLQSSSPLLWHTQPLWKTSPVYVLSRLDLPDIPFFRSFATYRALRNFLGNQSCFSAAILGMCRCILQVSRVGMIEVPEKKPLSLLFWIYGLCSRWNICIGYIVWDLSLIPYGGACYSGL